MTHPEPAGAEMLERACAPPAAIREMPIGGMPGSVFVCIAAGDVFTHSWDLARATGQPSDLDPGTRGAPAGAD
jgi:hypothetical protein